MKAAELRYERPAGLDATTPPEQDGRDVRLLVSTPRRHVHTTFDHLPAFLEPGDLLVVNVTSDAAVGAYEGWGGYGASKAAIELASATLARELKSDGVAVVAVDPGNMRTEMHQAAFPGEDISDRPTPDVTIPFWVWLLGQDPASISGSRFEAQGETWTVR